MYKIKYILEFAQVFVLVNGSLVDYFHYSKRVCQGDPRSPILFGLVEDFLSKCLIFLIDMNCQVPISLPRRSQALTHLLYANDVLLFCNGSLPNVRLVIHLYDFYHNLLVKLLIGTNLLFILVSILLRLGNKFCFKRLVCAVDVFLFFLLFFKSSFIYRKVRIFALNTSG